MLIQERCFLKVSLFVFLLGLVAVCPRGAAREAEEDKADQKTYPVSGFEILLPEGIDERVSAADLGAVSVDLVQVDDELWGKHDSGEPVHLTIDEFADGTTRILRGSAIRAVCSAAVSHLNELGFGGVYISPHPQDVRPGSLQDLRKEKGPLRLLVRMTRIGKIRTVGRGKRVGEDSRIDNPVHERIIRNSPLAAKSDTESGSLLDVNALSRYLSLLNRHPGRHVESAVSATSEVGEANLDYLVSESRPWMVYVQMLNTGTEATDEWRQRAGFINNQLFGFDDIFSFDYLTSDFGDASNAFSASYDFPLFGYDRLRLRPFALWSEYTADDVGRTNEEFEGESWSLGAEVKWNIYQQGSLFVDLALGLRWENQQVENRTFAKLFPGENFKGDQDFLIPHVGVVLARDTERSRTRGRLTLEGNIGSVDEEELVRLGRLNTDDKWFSLIWDIEHVFCLEALMEKMGEETPSNRNAHEIMLRCNGQWTLDDARLAPQYQAVAGGFFSVRGYPESIVAGDNMVCGTLEYRYHLGVGRTAPASPQNPEERGVRALRLSPRRLGVPQPFGLTFRLFCDVGYVNSNDAYSSEADGMLLGCGAGVEVQIFHNLNVRCDWGVALNDVENESGDVIDGAESGDNRFHVMATLVW